MRPVWREFDNREALSEELGEQQLIGTAGDPERELGLKFEPDVESERRTDVFKV